MKISPTRLITGIFLPLLLVVGIASELAAKQDLVNEESQSSSSAEVTVMIVMPEGRTLTGTAIIILEDISLQDVASVELARVTTPASTLMNDQATVMVPIDLSLVKPNATINVAVHIDSDDNGAFSNGDWFTDSLVSVITNSTMTANVGIVEIGAK